MTHHSTKMVDYLAKVKHDDPKFLSHALYPFAATCASILEKHEENLVACQFISKWSSETRLVIKSASDYAMYCRSKNLNRLMSEYKWFQDKIEFITNPEAAKLSDVLKDYDKIQAAVAEVMNGHEERVLEIKTLAEGDNFARKASSTMRDLVYYVRSKNVNRIKSCAEDMDEYLEALSPAARLTPKASKVIAEYMEVRSSLSEVFGNVEVENKAVKLARSLKEDLSSIKVYIRQKSIQRIQKCVVDLDEAISAAELDNPAILKHAKCVNEVTEWRELQGTVPQAIADILVDQEVTKFVRAATEDYKSLQLHLRQESVDRARKTHESIQELLACLSAPAAAAPAAASLIAQISGVTEGLEEKLVAITIAKLKVRLYRDVERPRADVKKAILDKQPRRLQDSLKVLKECLEEIEAQLGPDPELTAIVEAGDAALPAILDEIQFGSDEKEAKGIMESLTRSISRNDIKQAERYIVDADEMLTRLQQYTRPEASALHATLTEARSSGAASIHDYVRARKLKELESAASRAIDSLASAFKRKSIPSVQSSMARLAAPVAALEAEFPESALLAKAAELRSTVDGEMAEMICAEAVKNHGSSITRAIATVTAALDTAKPDRCVSAVKLLEKSMLPLMQYSSMPTADALLTPATALLQRVKVEMGPMLKAARIADLSRPVNHALKRMEKALNADKIDEVHAAILDAREALAPLAEMDCPDLIATITNQLDIASKSIEERRMSKEAARLMVYVNAAASGDMKLVLQAHQQIWPVRFEFGDSFSPIKALDTMPVTYKLPAHEVATLAHSIPLFQRKMAAEPVTYARLPALNLAAKPLRGMLHHPTVREALHPLDAANFKLTGRVPTVIPGFMPLFAMPRDLKDMDNAMIRAVKGYLRDAASVNKCMSGMAQLIYAGCMNENSYDSLWRGCTLLRNGRRTDFDTHYATFKEFNFVSGLEAVSEERIATYHSAAEADFNRCLNFCKVRTAIDTATRVARVFNDAIPRAEKICSQIPKNESSHYDINDLLTKNLSSSDDRMAMFGLGASGRRPPPSIFSLFLTMLSNAKKNLMKVEKRVGPRNEVDFETVVEALETTRSTMETSLLMVIADVGVEHYASRGSNCSGWFEANKTPYTKDTRAQVLALKARADAERALRVDAANREREAAAIRAAKELAERKEHLLATYIRPYPSGTVTVAGEREYVWTAEEERGVVMFRGSSFVWEPVRGFRSMYLQEMSVPQISWVFSPGNEGVKQYQWSTSNFRGDCPDTTCEPFTVKGDVPPMVAHFLARHRVDPPRASEMEAEKSRRDAAEAAAKRGHLCSNCGWGSRATTECSARCDGKICGKWISSGGSDCILCSDCRWSHKTNCIKCGSWLGSSTVVARRCRDCAWGSKATNCSRCGKWAP
eukprot:gnl/Dysnectes_brevis/4239_a5612_684.p1 GENE.gnl/Dysnectes_brevis/4239_a5612_684~~gnl/Dysnectes_brevis/4239_a5612_684.p1  ORF type:complete len:1426 (-),score=601.26 gnl/Dysnectes_brevis/4239_a5612_684:89-4270(-)